VGRPQGQAVLRLHEVLLALRQCPRPGLPGIVGHDRACGLASAVLRAGEVGRQVARDQDRRLAVAVALRDGFRSRRFEYAFLLDAVGIKQ
jgi:hypothetical protein